MKKMTISSSPKFLTVYNILNMHDTKNLPENCTERIFMALIAH